MSWLASVYSDYAGAGGQVVVEDLGILGARSVMQLKLDGTGTVTLDIDRQYQSAVLKPLVLRVDVEDGNWYEFRIDTPSTRVSPNDTRRLSVTGLAPWHDLSRRDIVRQRIGSRVLTRFDQEGSVDELLAQLIFTNLVVDRLTWFAPGVNEFTQRVRFVLDRDDRASAINKLIGLLKVAEKTLRRNALTLQYELDTVYAVGATSTPIYAHLGDRLQEYTSSWNFTNAYSVARVFGDAPTAESDAADLGQNSWRVDAVRALGPIGPGGIDLYASALRDAVRTDYSPVLEDGQFAAIPDANIPANGLQRATGLVLPILGASASAGEVFLSVPLDVHERVTITQSATGESLEHVLLPSAIDKLGYVTADVAIAGGRGERNWLRNGTLERATEDYAIANGGTFLPIPRDDTSTLHGEMHGTKGIGAPAQFDVDTFPHDVNVRRGERVFVDGFTAFTQADVISGEDGKAVLPILPLLEGDVPDATPIDVRRDGVSFTAVRANGPSNAIGAPTFATQDWPATPRLHDLDEITIITGRVHTAIVHHFGSHPFGGSQAVLLFPPSLWDIDMPAGTVVTIENQTQETSTTATVLSDVIAPTASLHLSGGIVMDPGDGVLVSWDSTVASVAIVDGNQPWLLPNVCALQLSDVVARALSSNPADPTYPRIEWRRAGGGSVVGLLTLLANAAAGDDVLQVSSAVVYRILAGTELRLRAESFIELNTVTLNSSGAGTLMVTANPTIALLDNAGVRVPRCPRFSGIGTHVLRVFGDDARATMVPASKCVRSIPVGVIVPAGESVILRADVYCTLWSPIANQRVPFRAGLYDVVSDTIVAQGCALPLDDGDPDQTTVPIDYNVETAMGIPTDKIIVLAATIPATAAPQVRAFELRVMSQRNAAAFDEHGYFTGAILWTSDASEGVPLADNHPNEMMRSALITVQQNGQAAREITMQFTAIDLAYAAALHLPPEAIAPIDIGVSIINEEESETLRVLSFERTQQRSASNVVVGRQSATINKSMAAALGLTVRGTR